MIVNHSPYFARIRRWCRKQDHGLEVFQWESIVFKFKKKVFAICSADTPLSITLKPKRENLDAYLYHPAIEIAHEDFVVRSLAGPAAPDCVVEPAAIRG